MGNQAEVTCLYKNQMIEICVGKTGWQRGKKSFARTQTAITSTKWTEHPLPPGPVLCAEDIRPASHSLGAHHALVDLLEHFLEANRAESDNGLKPNNRWFKGVLKERWKWLQLFIELFAAEKKISKAQSTTCRVTDEERPCSPGWEDDTAEQD